MHSTAADSGAESPGVGAQPVVSYEDEPIDTNAAGQEHANQRELLLRDVGF
jgi:hypothetical protein